MRVKIDNFHGIQPRLHPSLLGQGMATRAHNCVLESGKLVPLRQPSKTPDSKVMKYGGLTRLRDATSLHAWKWTSSADGVAVNFLAFKGVTWMAEGNIADDEYDRVFITGETGVAHGDAKDTPAVFFHSRSDGSVVPYTLVKDALGEPTVSVSGTVDPSKTVFYVSFFVSWYDEFGYESGLSAPSDMLEINDGTQVAFTVSDVPAEAEVIRVYMTRAGTDEAKDGIQFLIDHPVSGGLSFSVDVHPADTAEQEPGIEPIPADLRCMQFVAGGYYTGFSKSNPKTVMFSDVGLVTSWPLAFRYDVKDNIVALATTSNSVFALTDGWPWVLTGTAPETMSVSKLAGPAACVSPLGVCVYRNAVYYASNEGLMSIQNSADAGTVCVNITQKVFTKDQWQAMNPSSCRLLQHGGRLFLFFKRQDGSAGDNLVINLSESADAVTTHDESARCACVDNVTGDMYFVRYGEEA